MVESWIRPRRGRDGVRVTVDRLPADAAQPLEEIAFPAADRLVPCQVLVQLVSDALARLKPLLARLVLHVSVDGDGRAAVKSDGRLGDGFHDLFRFDGRVRRIVRAVLVLGHVTRDDHALLDGRGLAAFRRLSLDALVLFAALRLESVNLADVLGNVLLDALAPLEDAVEETRFIVPGDARQTV